MIRMCVLALAALGLTAALAAEPVSFAEADIRASRTISHELGTLPARPSQVFQGVVMANLFIVVETGDQHVTIMDGDTLEPIHRLVNRHALHGGPQFTPDGRYVFFAARDGWITKFDLWTLQLVAEVRAGITTRALTVSGDGKYLAVANDQPMTLVLLDGDLNPLRVHAVKDKAGKTSSRVAVIRAAVPRKSFVVALQDVPEVWEVSYDPATEDIAVGMVHDFQYKEGAFASGFLNPRRSVLPEPLDDFSFSLDYSELMGTGRETGKGQLVNLDVRRKIADLNPPSPTERTADIRTDSGWRRVPVTFTRSGRYALAILSARKADGGALIVLDATTLQEIKRMAMDGPAGPYTLPNTTDRAVPHTEASIE